MEFGICVASKIDDVGIASVAENLGYRQAWFADSQMIWSDAYACLALAAERTRTIKLGTGVSVVDTRIAPVTAHSIASINVLAPGRVFLGIGNGFTAWRLMAHKPARLVEFENHLRTVRGLLDGDEVAFTHRGQTTDVAFQMEHLGFVNTADHIPIYVSAFGPKGQALAGRYGDGLIVAIPPEQRAIDRVLANASKGAEQDGRTLDRDSFTLTTLTTACVLAPGEDLTSDRVIETCGPMALMGLHYAYERQRQFKVEPPPHLHAIWDRYTALIDQTPEAARHFRIHAGHATFMHPDEVQFVTPETIKAACLVGTADELVETIVDLEQTGLTGVMLLPSFSTRYRAMEDFATSVMSRL